MDEIQNRKYVDVYFQEIKEIIDNIDRDEIVSLMELLSDAKRRTGRLFIFGVGGSAANASHAVNDFRKLFGMETYTPMDNVSELTARINDDGWDSSLVGWMKVSNFNSNDTAMILSVGGGSAETSQNLVQAMKYAKQSGASLVSIVSRDGGIAKQLSDHCVLIPVISVDRITPHAEEWQGIIWHLVVNCLANQKGD
jgi:D-sedoheptulose 7-phosphate isomerase